MIYLIITIIALILIAAYENEWFWWQKK